MMTRRISFLTQVATVRLRWADRHINLTPESGAVTTLPVAIVLGFVLVVPRTADDRRPRPIQNGIHASEASACARQAANRDGLRNRARLPLHPRRQAIILRILAHPMASAIRETP
jgi:hypothetical protein